MWHDGWKETGNIAGVMEILLFADALLCAMTKDCVILGCDWRIGIG